MRLSRKILVSALAIYLLTAGVLPAQDRAFPYELNKRNYWLLPVGIGYLVPVLHREGRGDRVSVAAAPNLVIVCLRF